MSLSPADPGPSADNLPANGRPGRNSGSFSRPVPGGTGFNGNGFNGASSNGASSNGASSNGAGYSGAGYSGAGSNGVGGRDGWLAAPYAETPSFQPTAGRLARARAVAGSAIDDLHPKAGVAHASIRAGGCFVKPLPLDATCASAARSFFREAVAGTGLPGDLIHDGVTMASELAANTLNAHGNIEYGGHGHRPVTGIPEFWLYVRTCGSGREIVCKIFDSDPGWDAGEPVPIGAAVPAGRDSVRGRGLQMVAGLSAGMWGHHLSRGRLGVWKVPGKAVWFALRVPATSDLARSERLAPRGAEAIEELAVALTERGLGTGLVPVTEPGGELAVLSVSHKLTVWCQGQVVWFREPGGDYDRLKVTDLVEATERIVAAHEELASGRRPGRPVAVAAVGAAPASADAADAASRAQSADSLGASDSEAGYSEAGYSEAGYSEAGYSEAGYSEAGGYPDFGAEFDR
jgi:hypothetical protein